MDDKQQITEEAMQLIREEIRNAIINSRELQQLMQRLEDQSYALREIAVSLTEYGIPVTRFTRRTTEVLVAVALNGEY